jgi:hypothetical protein
MHEFSLFTDGTIPLSRLVTRPLDLRHHTFDDTLVVLAQRARLLPNLVRVDVSKG